MIEQAFAGLPARNTLSASVKVSLKRFGNRLMSSLAPCRWSGIDSCISRAPFVVISTTPTPCIRARSLRANIAETLLVPLITEQGGKEIQHEEHENIFSSLGCRAKRGRTGRGRRGAPQP